MSRRKPEYQPTNAIPTGVIILRMQDIYNESSPETQTKINQWKAKLIARIPGLGDGGSLELIYKILYRTFLHEKAGDPHAQDTARL